MIENTPSTQTQAPQPITPNQKQIPMLVVGAVIAVAVIIVLLMVGKKMGVNTGLQMQEANQNTIPVGSSVDSNQEFVNNNLAVLSPTAAGELNLEQSTWQTVSRDGFQLKFPTQFFDESDTKYSTYYNPLTDNQSYVTDEGIQFSYRSGLLNGRDIAAIAQSVKSEEADQEPDKYTDTQTFNYNGVEVVSYETKDNTEKEYFYFFRLADQEHWQRIQATVHDPNQVGYNAVVQQIMNTLTLSI